MSTRSAPPFLILLLALLTPLAGTTNGDSPFKGNRRPGILAEPTEAPTGENALFYRRMGNLRADELLELLSESPTDRD